MRKGGEFTQLNQPLREKKEGKKGGREEGRKERRKGGREGRKVERNSRFVPTSENIRKLSLLPPLHH